MDFGKSFVFMFQDPHWFRKVLIGTLLLLGAILFSWILIGLVALILVLGYAQVTLRNVLDRQEHPLPEWDAWGDFFMRGLKLFVALLIWLLPFLILIIPLSFGSALTNNQSNAGAAGGLLIACSVCLMLLWGIFVALIAPAIYVRLAAFDRFAAAFEVGELWSFTTANIGNIILVLLLLLLVGWIAVPIIGLLGLIVCVIGVLISIPFASLWQALVTAHLFGQIGAYGNRPVQTPTPEPIPTLPSEHYEEPAPTEAPVPEEAPAARAEETAPVEGPTVPDESLETVVEAPQVEAPPETPAATEPPAEPPPTEETK
jgi:hypothetical protein